MLKNFMIRILKISASIFVLNHTISANGVYFGFNLGANHLAGVSTIDAYRNNIGAKVGHQFSPKLSNSNIHGDIFAGYGMYIDQLWVAAEAHVGLSALETETLLHIADVSILPSVKVKSSHNGGISMHAGYQISPSTMAYVKLGAEVRKFSAEITGKSVVGDNLVEHAKRYYSVGVVPGFGVETEVSPGILLRSEYKAAIHPVSRHKTIGINGSFTNVKTKPTVHHVSLGFNFKI